MSIVYLLVNFGGPRSLKEVEPFLKSLLTDQDVVRTGMPQWFHNILFKRVARKRAKKISDDYVKIGGGSPIYADTEAIAKRLQEKLNAPVLTFHRYLPATHEDSISKIISSDAQRIVVFPFFPQFTYATTGSIARFFCEHLPKEIVNKMRWVKSYPEQKNFVQLAQNIIKNYLKNNSLEEQETVLIFSAHGVPKKFIETGDLYESECRASFEKISCAFPKCLSYLTYQSKFGPGEWLQPYTQDFCERIKEFSQDRKHVAFYPLSFTSDHIETLFEIEEQYMPLIHNQGLQVHRIPAFNRDELWINAIFELLQECEKVHNCMLVRCGAKKCCQK